MFEIAQKIRAPFLRFRNMEETMVTKWDDPGFVYIRMMEFDHDKAKILEDLLWEKYNLEDENASVTDFLQMEAEFKERCGKDAPEKSILTHTIASRYEFVNLHHRNPFIDSLIDDFDFPEGIDIRRNPQFHGRRRRQAI